MAQVTFLDLLSWRQRFCVWAEQRGDGVSTACLRLWGRGFSTCHLDGDLGNESRVGVLWRARRGPRARVRGGSPTTDAMQPPRVVLRLGFSVFTPFR
jgi:hypothetical protein